MKHIHNWQKSISSLVILSIVCLTGLASDSPVLDRVTKQGVLRVGMSGDQAPMNAKNRTGQLIGLEVDLATLLAAAMDVRLEPVVKPFGQLLPALKAGEVDIVMSGMTITAERTASVSFVGPYMVSGKSILTKSKTLAAAKEAVEINKANLTVTALENSTSESFVKKHLTDVKLVTSTDYDTAVKMVIDGQADALVADMPVCVLSLLRFPGADLVTLGQPFTIEPIGMAISAEDRQFLNLLENYFRALEGLGIMQQLRAKWLEDGSWIAALP
jgi:polar amino acid transport system substrate-binding protein